jgi:hypothetical protein
MFIGFTVVAWLGNETQSEAKSVIAQLNLRSDCM